MIILLWLRVKSREKSAFTGLETVATAQSKFKWITAAPTISTSCMTQGLVTPVTAALTNPLTNDLGVKLKYCVTAFFFKITNRPGPPFPASRGLSRRGKMKREEGDLACFQRVSYHACARVSLQLVTFLSRAKQPR